MAQGENIVVRWVVYGTHEGDGLGMPPCHRPVTIQGITWIRVQDGQFVEGWDRWNLGGFLANLQTDETAPDAA